MYSQVVHKHHHCEVGNYASIDPAGIIRIQCAVLYTSILTVDDAEVCKAAHFLDIFKSELWLD